MTKLATIRSSPNVIDGSAAAGDLELSADVCVIGSGAGGAVVASVLAEAGISVLLVEEGGYYSTADFDMTERHTTPKLYQDGGQRATADGAITVLQGRAVGGTTVVNWTTSFRTPEDVVDHWSKRHAVKGFKYADLVPHYEAIEARLAIHKVAENEMNLNNRKLFEGCRKLGIAVETTRRNVHACMQTGYCGMGCPVNAKRSMLVTLIPDAIDAGAKLLFRCRIDKLETAGGEAKVALGTLLDGGGYTPTGRKVRLSAKRFVISCGAINGPGMLLRSGLDSGGRVGRRTFLHPAIGSVALYDQRIEAFYGAPQSCASHAFAHRGEGKVGVFLEAAPAYPMASGAITPGFGTAHRTTIENLANVALHAGILIDGFSEGEPGGTVTLRPSGAPVLDYPILPAIWEAFRFSQKRLAEIGFASGAKQIATTHEPPLVMKSAADIEQIDALPWQPGSFSIYTAHQMGGCAMGDDATTSVVRSEDLRHHTLRNLYVMDGSVFPTSLGVNPQESIYGLTRLMATRLAAVAKG